MEFVAVVALLLGALIGAGSALLRG